MANVYINSMHFPLPFLHHCGASCLCADALLHWCVEKSGSQSDSVQEQVPAVVQIIQRFWQDWIFEWQHLQAANFKRSSLLMLIKVSIVSTKWLVVRFGQNKLISPWFREVLKLIFAAIFLKPIHLLSEELWDLFVDCGLACIVVLRASWSHSPPMAQRWP